MFIMNKKNKNRLTKVAVFGLLLTFVFGCNSSSEKNKEKIELALDKYDQITTDYDSYMRQMEKDNPGKISQESAFNSAKNTCLRLKGIDISETPLDFQAAFKKSISVDCDDLKSPTDQVIYEGDLKKKEFDDALQQLEKVSAKYGYDYKYSKTLK
jgi:predicted negative regulator of RcsB-dependent stress response